uniref:Xylulose kinase-1 n=1 Tax=Tanacetum cinerariifolium TaxID=118510 RepID=A0A6L2KE22_TANCI|nr:hypothetical protein [Tanacetum cinerariifolium]
MAPLTFADTHNMIAFLTNFDESEGFNQIVDFLTAHTIQYALMVNPTTYVSCIKQFWASVSIKKSNDAVKLQALIDRKKVIITEDTIRQALRLDDADGIDCLPNEEIFAELARMGYEKPSTKLTFYKAFFSAQWKFLIHTIVQCMNAKRTAWNEFSSSMASAKVFANMRRIGKRFSGVDTPLFDAILVQHVQDDVEVEEDEDEVPASPSPPTPAPTSPPQQKPILSPPQAQSAQPSSPPQKQPPQAADISKSSMTLLNKLMETCRVRKLEKKRKSKSSGLKRLKKMLMRITLVDADAEVEMDTNIQGMMAESQAKTYNLDLQHSEKVLSMQDTDEAEVEEVLEVVTATKLMTEVVTTAAEVPKASAPRRRRGVVIQDPEETAAASSVIVHSKIDMDEAFARQLEAELNANINWDDVVEQVKRSEKQDNTVMRYQALKRKPVTEAQAKKNMMIYLKNMAGFKMDFFKEEVTVQEKRQGENLEQETAKKQRIDEDAEELKRHLQIVANDDDDVYIESTLLASKVPVVDYQIHHENNKHYYKIIRADGTHKLFLSFITLLKNFDREDLETLWKLVKERFESTEPKNFSDDFLLNILKIMFEKPNVEANKFLLVEKKYPLTHFTLEQMLNNDRLEIEEESEMSLELLSFGVDAVQDFKKMH